MLANDAGKQQDRPASVNGSRKRSPARSRDSPGIIDLLTCKPCRKNRNSDPEGRHLGRNNNINSTSSVTQPHTASAPTEGSLKRPLSCKTIFGKRKHHLTPVEETTIGSTIRQHWRSLPNLRSPSLTVRAMTLKFKSLTNKDTDQSHHQISSFRKKRAHFNEAVDVILHDDDGNQIDTQCVKIKYDDEAYMPGAMAYGGQDELSLDRSPALRDRRHANKDDLRLDYMDIKRKIDGQKFIKMVIHIGQYFDRKRISVRSANGGTKIVLVAYKSQPLGDGTYFWREHVEKFRLPHAIDPNSVNAVLHSAGDLVIEAPLFEFDPDT